MARILLIDDDAEFGELLRQQLAGNGHEVRLLDNGQEGLDLLSSGTPCEIVLLDNKMPRMTGIEFLSVLQARQVELPVILMTSVHRDQTVIEAMNLGAFSYVLKPMDLGQLGDEFEREIHSALAVHRSPGPVRLTQKPPVEESTLIGTSRPMLDVLKQIGRLARMAEPVLILGETGTGKDLVARAIHTNSSRRHKPFVVMNCAAFNDNLLDDELFGHEPGAFTGADKLRKGRFEHANGGTLFLDEVGDMPMTLQAKLLRVLENREVVRIGSNEPIKVDVRVVSATHRDLVAAVQAGSFREDLYYRLEGMTIHLPPLRDRRDDIPLLAACFLSRIAGGEAGPTLHPAAAERLKQHDWPGNVRQLQRVLCRAAGTCRGSHILADDLELGDALRKSPPGPAAASAPASGFDAVIAAAWDSGSERLWPMLVEQMEKQLLQFALAQAGISQVQLARRLGIARNTLRARIEEYGLKLPESE